MGIFDIFGRGGRKGEPSLENSVADYARSSGITDGVVAELTDRMQDLYKISYESGKDVAKSAKGKSEAEAIALLSEEYKQHAVTQRMAAGIFGAAVRTAQAHGKGQFTGSMGNSASTLMELGFYAGAAEQFEKNSMPNMAQKAYSAAETVCRNYAAKGKTNLG